MSRCFPYPPPGFEPKLKNNHVDLSHKDKHKEKKHKKEKKDKREGKEKREKDRHHSKERHRENDKDKEKKDRKEKHKHKKREEREREKTRAQPLVPVPTEKTPEDSRIVNEHSRRVGEGSHAGPGSQFTERRFAGNSTYGASEKKPMLVPVQQPVPSVLGKCNEAVKVGPTSQSTNHRVTVSSERRVPCMPSSSSPEEGVISKRTVPSASKPNVTNPNSLVQRKSNGSSNQVTNHLGAGFTERRVAGPEAKKPVPSSFNSLQGKTNGPTSQANNHHQLPLTGSTQNRIAVTERGADLKRVSGDSVVLMQRKTDGPIFQVTNNHHAAGVTERRVGLNQSMGPTTSALEKDKEKSGMRGNEEGAVKLEEGRKEKRKERDEKKEREKELRRQEKKQRKEREREEKEKKKDKERDKVKEERGKLDVGISMVRPDIEWPQRNIEKVGGMDGILSKKRKEGESNGFLHENDMRAQKLVRTSPPDPLKRKDALTNGFMHETDVGSTKLTKKLSSYPPPLENGKTSHHPPPFLSPPAKPSSNSPSADATNYTPINNSTVKADVSLMKKAPAPQLNGTMPDAKVHKKRKEVPPHPDLKYLNVVYSVPKVEEKDLNPPFDDQEWLFGTKPNGSLEPNFKMLESGLSDGPGQVWDRAVRLDSADAVALPYVVPF